MSPTASTATAASRPGWAPGRSYGLGGLTVDISAPRCLGRCEQEFWFPQIARFPSGDLLLVGRLGADHASFQQSVLEWSRDGGLTWTAPRLIDVQCFNILTSPDGRLQLMPSYVYRRPGFETYSHYAAPRMRISDGARQEVERIADGITIERLPQPDSDHGLGAIGQDTERRLGLSTISLDAQTIRDADGTYLSTAYVALSGSTRYTAILLESGDAVSWRMRSIIAGSDCGIESHEGSDEPALCRLKDGRLMCVFRTGSRYGQTWSDDDGRTWSKAIAMEQRSALPRLLVRRDGTVLLLGGRPDLWLWIDTSGTGTRWQAVDLLAHHNALVPDEPLLRNDGQQGGYGTGRSSSYIGVDFLDDATLVLVYDRTPVSPMDWSRHTFSDSPDLTRPLLAPDEPVRDRLQTYSCWIQRVALRS